MAQRLTQSSIEKVKGYYRNEIQNITIGNIHYLWRLTNFLFG